VKLIKQKMAKMEMQPTVNVDVEICSRSWEIVVVPRQQTEPLCQNCFQNSVLEGREDGGMLKKLLKKSGKSEQGRRKRR
jgi:hypothetical protein